MLIRSLSFSVLMLSFLVTPSRCFVFPTSVQGWQNFRLPKSLTNPNMGLSIADSVSVSVDKTNGNVNLAGGVSHGFALDAGILTKTLGGSVNFREGQGMSSAMGGGSAFGNGGAAGTADVRAWVPTVVDGMGFSRSNVLTNAFGNLGRSTGRAAALVG